MSAWSESIRRSSRLQWLIVFGVLAAAAALGYMTSESLLALLAAGAGALLLIRKPVLGLFAVVAVALLARLDIATGTEVALNPVTLLLPGLLGLWLLVMAVRGKIAPAPSRVNRPLLLFTAMGPLSLFIGLVLWDPTVPRGDIFLLVQMAQWVIFALSAGALLLCANLVKEEDELRRLTFWFLGLGGALAILGYAPGVEIGINRIATQALIRAPFWALLIGLAGGQLLFNRRLTLPWRVFLLAVVGTTLYYSFVIQREGASNWVGVTVTGAVLGWLRWPRLRWLFAAVVLGLALIGVLFPAVYEFAGGDDEWFSSGGSRIALFMRVIEDTVSHNAVTGLGPAAYRLYGAMRPLQYEHIIWMTPRISSHNNYVDIFGHMGMVGLALFGWLAAAIARTGLGLRKRALSGFAAGYVNGMLAVLAGSLALMLLADWILPFVYNIGFPGFQASVLIWLFLGGLVILGNMENKPAASV